MPQNGPGLVRAHALCGRELLDRLAVSVTFDERRGYVGTAPALRQPVAALSLNGLRRRRRDGRALGRLVAFTDTQWGASQDTGDVAAGRAFIGDQSRVALGRGDPHHVLHRGLAARARYDAFSFRQI